MNKVYRVIWNESLGAWVAVSELSKSKTKSSKTRTIGSVIAAGLMLTFSAGAIAAGAPMTTCTPFDLGIFNSNSLFGQNIVCAWNTTNSTLVGNNITAAGNGVNLVAVGNNISTGGERSTVLGSEIIHSGRFTTVIGQNIKSRTEHSIVMGEDTTIDGGNYDISIGGNQNILNSQHTVALGNNINTSGSINSLAAGDDTTIINSRLATAVGDRASVTDSTASSAFGAGSSIKKADHSTAVGEGASVNKSNSSFAGGENASITGGYGNIAIGFTSTVSNTFGSTAIGYQSSVTGNVTGNYSRGMALGTHAKVTDSDRGTALGASASVTNSASASASGNNASVTDSSYAQADGAGAKVTSSKSATAVGNDAIVTNSGSATAVGNGANITDSASSVAVGQLASVTNSNVSTASGYKAKITDSYQAQAYGTGNSIANSNQASAFGVNSSITSSASGVAIGNNAKLNSAADGIAIGSVAKASAASTIALGNQAEASVFQSIALGSSAKASAADTVALGTGSIASGNSAIALGNKAQALGSNSISIGKGNIVSGNNSAAIGDPNNISGNNSSSLGNNNTIATNDTFVVGSNVTTTLDNSVFLGKDAAYTAKGASTDGVGKVSDAKVGGITYAGTSFAGQTPVGVVSVGDDGKERRIQNMAAGLISATSTDAINGSQLYATNEVLGNVANTVVKNFGGNATLNPDGNITYTNIGNTGKDNIHDAIKAATTKVAGDQGVKVTAGTPDPVTGATTYTVAAKTDDTTVKVDGNGNITAVTSDITTNANGVATVTAPTSLATAGDVAEAINASGFNIIGAGNNAGGAFANELINPGDTVTLEAGKNLTVAQTNGKFVFATADAVSFNSVTAGSGANQVVLDNDGVKVGGKTYISDAGLNANDKKITNVADGDVTSTSKDAINGSQLRNTAGDIAGIIGGNATVDNAGNVTASNIGGTGANTIDDAIKTVKTTVKSTDNTIKVTANTADATNGTVFDISVDAQKLAESAQLPVVYTDADGNKVYKVGGKFTKDPTGQDATQEVTATNVIASMQNADGTTATATKLANIAKGDVSSTSKDAINGSQLFAQGEGVKNIIGGNTTYNPNTGAYENNDIGGTGKGNINDAIQTVNTKADANATEIAKGLNFGANDQTATAGDAIKRQLGETIGVKGGITNTSTATSGENVITRTDANGNINIELAKNAKFDSLTTGNTLVDNSGITIKAPTTGTTTDVKLTASGLNNGGNKITNVAAGTDATDAVNKGQLDKAQAAATTKVAEGKNVTVSEQTNADGSKTYTVATKDDVNFNSVTAGSGANQVVLGNDGVKVGGNTYISNAGLNANDKKITNVANGDVTSTSKDAINGSQLRNTADDIASIIGGNATVDNAGNVTASNIGGTGANTIDDAIKTVKTTVKSTDNTIKVTANTANANDGTVFDISVDAQKLAESAQLPVVYTKADGTKVYKVGNSFFDNKEGTGTAIDATDVIASMQNADGTISPTTLANIKAGTKATDAVNVSQLKGAVDALGGGAAINTDGTIKAPTYNITNPANGTVTTANNVGDALKGLNDAVNSPLTFKGDSGEFNRNLGQTTTVKGGITDTAKLSDNNIGVVAKEGTLDIKLAKDIAVDSVKTGDTTVNTYGVSIVNADPNKVVSLTASGLNNGNNRITNVAAGQAGTDAVNKDQLDKAQAAATTKVTEGKNVTVSEQTNADGSKTYTVATKDDVNFNSVTAGSGANQVVLGNDGVKVGGNTYISNAGLNANDKKITNVANGDVTSTSKDAINGSQLHAVSTATKNLIGGNATVNSDGTVTASNIGGTGANTIDDAIKTVKTTVKSTDNTIKVTANTANANDGTVFDISVDAQKLAESAQLPVVYTKADGTKVYKVGNSFFDNKEGTGTAIDATDVIASMQNADGTISPTTLANIKAGTKATDAVNVSQLKGAVDALGGGAAINTDGTIKAPTYNITNPANGTVTTANNVGDALKGLNDAVNSPLTFKGDSGEFNRNLGQTTTVKGGITDTAKLSDNNIGVVAKDGTLDIKLAKDIAVDSVKTGDTTVNTYGVSIVNADPNKVVSLTASGLNNGNNRITNVAAGQAGTDAVNKDQLDKAQAAATTKVTEGKNVTVSEQTNADGSKTYTVATKDDVNFNSVTAGSGANQVVLGNDGVKVGGNTYISDTGLNANDKKITNVANGDVTSTSKDAINGSQLHAVSTATKNLIGGNATVNSDGTVTASNIGGTGANTIDDAIKTVKTTVKSTDNTIKVTANTANANDGTVFDISVDAQKLAESAQLPVVYTKADGTKVYKVGNSFFDNKEGTGTAIDATDVIASMQNADGTISPTTLANIKAGTKATDAVNVSQLKGAVDALGGGAAINTDGTIKAPTYNITNPANGTVTAANNVGDALKGLNDAVNSPLTFKGDSGEFNRNLGQTTTVKGGITDTAKLSDNNIGVVAKDGTLDIKLAKDIAVDSVKTGDTTVNTYGVSIVNADPNKVVSLTASGLNNGNNRITNVAAGVDATDAVNVSQLKAVEATANQGWNLTTNGKADSKSNVKPGDTVDFANTDGNVKIENKGNNVIVNLNKDIDLTKDGSVTIGDTKVNNDGLTIAGGPSVTKSGIDAGDKKITNVAPGKISADSKDAINGSQLYTVQQAAVAAKTEVKAGDNVEVKKESGGNGQDIYTVSAKDTSASVTAGSDAITVNKADPKKVVTVDVTDYKVDLSQATKDNIQKGVDAKGIVDNKGLTFAGDNNSSTEVQKLGSTVNVNGDSNITTQASGNTVKVTLNPNVTVESLTATNSVNVGSGNAQVALTTNVGKDDVRELSVGSANAPTRITNVARGVNDTDAVNLSQLKDLGYNINTKIDKVEKEANAGIASAMAMETAPFIAGKWTYAVGAAYHGGEQAVGATLRKTADNGRWSLTGGVATGTEGDPSVRIGISGVID